MNRKFEWKSDEWYVDKYGQLKLKEAFDDEWEVITLRPIYSEEKAEYLMEEVKE